MPVVSRREFVAACVTLVSTPALLSADPLYVYASESGAPYSYVPQVLGFLMLTQPDRHIAAIRKIKEDVGCRRRLRFHGTDRMKISAGRELMHYFVREPDLRFTASLWQVNRNPGAAWSEAFRIQQYQDLFRSAAIPPATILRMKSRRASWDESHGGNRDKIKRTRRGAAATINPNHSGTHFGEPAQRFQALHRQNLILRGEAVTLSANDGLIELSSLLAGSAYRDHDPTSRIDPDNANGKIILRLRTLLGLSSLAEGASEKWRVVRPKP
jgi:hypothetical protein